MKRDENNNIYLTMSEAVDAGMSYNTISKARQRGSKSMRVVLDWEDGNARLLDYGSLAPRYKKMVLNKFGDPREYVALEPIKQLVIYDEKAERFYLAYRFGEDNKALPHEKIVAYTWAASWLNMIKLVDEDKSILKEVLKLKVDEFYKHVGSLIKTGSIDLPTSYRRLRKALNCYTSNGYETLISGKFGHQNNAKVSDELSKGILLEMIDHGNQHDDVFIKMQYNKWADKKGYEEISTATVRRYRKENEADGSISRQGNAVFKNNYAKQSKGFRPTMPLRLVESDDNHKDLYFTELAIPGQKRNDYRRYKAIVVTDSFNDYTLGYAYSLHLSTDLVRAAYISAMHHLRRITGNWILPHETKTDKWATKELIPFYQSMGHYIPAALGNKNRGYIENFFGTPHFKRCLKAGSINYKGNNVTARNAGVNPDFVKAHEKDRPLIGEEAYDQIDAFFHRLRYMEVGDTGISKHDEWMAAYNKMSEQDKRIITDEQYLLKFGVEHNYRGKGIEITNRGVEPQIGNVQYSFDLEQYNIRDIGKRVSVFYDPTDMNQVLLTNHSDFRMMAYSAIKHPRALMDHSEGTRAYLNAVHDENRDIVNKIAAKKANRQALLSANNIDPEAALLDLSLSKEIRQEAEAAYLYNTTTETTQKVLKGTQKSENKPIDLADLY